MELIQTLGIQSIGFVALVTFGLVAAINFWKEQTSRVNFALSVVFAILFSFVPNDLGSVIANRIKDGIAVAVGLNGAYQALKGILKNNSLNQTNI